MKKHPLKAVVCPECGRIMPRTLVRDGVLFCNSEECGKRTSDKIAEAIKAKDAGFCEVCGAQTHGRFCERCQQTWALREALKHVSLRFDFKEVKDGNMETKYNN